MPRRSAMRGDERGRSGPRPAGGAGEADRGERLARHLRRRCGGAARSRARRRRRRGGLRNADRAAVPDRVRVRAQLPSSPREPTTVGEPEAAQGSVVAADVAASPPERDGGAAAHRGFENGEPAGRVHEGVCGGHPFGHAVGEPLDANAWLAGEARRDALVELAVVPAQADDSASRDPRRGRSHRSGHVADAPASSGDEHDRSTCRAGRARAGRSAASSGVRNSGRREAVHAVDLGRGPGDAAYLRNRLGMGDEVHVDAGACPVVECGEIGDRRADRDRPGARRGAGGRAPR